MKPGPCRFILLMVCLLLAGCRTVAPETPIATRIPASPAATRTAVPTWTPTATALPPTPSPTRTPTMTPQPTATATPFPACAPIWQRAFPKGEPLRDVILFTSEIRAPFAPASIQQQKTLPQLWAISADGRRSKRLSADADTLYVRPTDGGVSVDLLVTQPYSLETDFIRQHILGPECTDTAFPCNTYTFSPGGAWAAYFWGEELCGRGIAALNLNTDERRTLAEGGGHSFTFLTDEQMLIGVGHCEGGELRLVNLATGDQTTLGAEGTPVWNAPRTAFAVNAHPHLGWGSVVWGYNLVRGQLFIAMPAERHTQESQPLWTPTGDYLLYQQRVLSPTNEAGSMITVGPQQIIRVDADTGIQQTLLADPAYDFHLCLAYGKCEWDGDFIEVRRIPFHAQTFDLEANPDDPGVSCAAYGFRCPDPVERFALNWQTGELVPWDARPATTPPTPGATPKPTATPAPPAAPDLSGPAFYTAPDDRYALYLGQDGQSLWCFQAGTTAEPVLWIINGNHFTYIP